MNKKNTKRALVLSVLALLLCVSMLVGTTFAWFTDNVTSGSNIIKSGNLDVAVEYSLDGTNWENIEGANIFEDSAWEPGYTKIVALKITNAGSLAFKYNLNMKIIDEIIGKNKEGNDIVLSDILMVDSFAQAAANYGDIMVDMVFSGRDSGSWNTVPFKQLSILEQDNLLLAQDDAEYVFLRIEMPETVGNEANHDGVNIPAISFGVNVVATQYTYESDSFGNDYDAEATYPEASFPDFELISNGEQLVEALENGGSYVLADDITVEKDETIVINSGVETVIDLNGKEISGENSRTNTHNFLISLEGGTLTATNGTISMDHTGANMGWNGAATVINVTAGGVLNLENVTVSVDDGTDMNFAVHLNNWGEVTLNANNCVFDAPYCGVRVNNSGPDMNNITITNSTLTGNTRAFWVHNYTSADMAGKIYSGASQAYDQAVVDARLNIDIYNNGNTFAITGSAKAPIRYGFTGTIYFDETGTLVP